MLGTSLTVAYLGGLLTLLAPCAALLLPSFFAYAFSSRAVLASRTLIFFLGLLTGLIPLGLGAGQLGGWITAHAGTIAWVGGLIIIVLGLWQALALPTPHLPRRRKKIRAEDTEKKQRWWKPSDKSSPLGVYLLGLTYGIAGIGCSGPILGSVLTLAAFGGSPWVGGLTMAVYAAGMFTPVAVLAFAWDALGSKKDWFKPHPVTLLGRATTRGNIISGVIFIILGLVLVIFGGANPLPGVLDASGQIALETKITQIFAGVPNWLFLAFLGSLIFLGVAYYLHRRARNRSQGEGE